jgi:hypothetical protein
VPLKRALHHRMDGLGLLVILAFLILILAIVTNSCADWSVFEGFSNKKVVPPPVKLIDEKEVKGYTNVADLPGAPVTGLAQTNSLPFQDPALMKASRQVLNELKQDMDGFAANELPGLEDKSDPGVKLPVTRFKGDYQRVKDELRVVTRNDGLESQLTMDDIQGIAANLRFLQRSYRLFMNNGIVPQVETGFSKVGTEGFMNEDKEKTPISPDQLNMLAQKLAVEVTRLQATGTTDPIIQARVDILTKMKQTVDDLNMKVKSGKLSANQIPIMTSDYDKFLPELNKTGTGIGGLISKSFNPTLGSLFNSYEKGDLEGSELAGDLFDEYARDLLKGLSVKVSYTSENEVSLELAKALSSLGAYSYTEPYSSSPIGPASNHPGTVKGARGEFEEQIRKMDVQELSGSNGSTFSGIRPPSYQPTKIGQFDWKRFSDVIVKNIRRMGMNPYDFGALKDNSSVSKDFSWRGHVKMMCSRLATADDPAVPEQVGCPPVSWKGWRL